MHPSITAVFTKEKSDEEGDKEVWSAEKPKDYSSTLLIHGQEYWAASHRRMRLKMRFDATRPELVFPEEFNRRFNTKAEPAKAQPEENDDWERLLHRGLHMSRDRQELGEVMARPLSV